MARSGVALSFAILLAVFEIGSCLRCYQCNSQMDKDCMDAFSAGNKNPVDCSSSEVSSFHRSVLQNVIPSHLSELTPGAPKYCAKIVFQTGTTVRTCLDGNPLEPNKNCRDLDSAGTFPGNKVKFCSMCDKELCNAAGSLSASLPVALLALVASYIYYKQ